MLVMAIGHLVALQRENGNNYATTSPIDLKTGMHCFGPWCRGCLWGPSRLIKKHGCNWSMKFEHLLDQVILNSFVSAYSIDGIKLLKRLKPSNRCLTLYLLLKLFINKWKPCHKISNPKKWEIYRYVMRLSVSFFAQNSHCSSCCVGEYAIHDSNGVSTLYIPMD